MKQIECSYHSLVDEPQINKKSFVLPMSLKGTGQKTYFQNNSKGELVAFVKADISVLLETTTEDGQSPIDVKQIDLDTSMELTELTESFSSYSAITRNMIRDQKQIIVDTNFEKNKLQDDNIGFKMLKNLGWQGGSLGKNLDGIEEPVR